MKRLNKAEAERLVKNRIMVLENGLVWLGVHGNLCLALRHPQNRGASRKLMVDFVKRLGRLLVIYGVVTEEELKRATRLEIEEGSVDLK